MTWGSALGDVMPTWKMPEEEGEERYFDCPWCGVLYKRTVEAVGDVFTIDTAINDVVIHFSSGGS
jgi:hypothetical protein